MSEEAIANQGVEADDTTGNEGQGQEVQKPTWTEQLPEALRDNEKWQGFATIGDLAKAYESLEGERESLVKVPGEGSTDEERQAFNSRLGIPESPEGYEIRRSELPEGYEHSEEAESAYKGAAHKLGLTPKQVQGMYDHYMDMVNTGLESEKEARTKAHNEAVEGLKQKWGQDYDKNLEEAVRAVEKVGGDELKNHLDLTGKGDDPALIEAFHTIGRAMSEDSFEPGGKGGGPELSEEEKARKLFPSTYGGQK